MAYLYGFRPIPLKHAIEQEASLDWLAAVHAEAAAGVTVPPESPGERLARFSALVRRYGCGSGRIARRGHELEDIGSRDWPRNRIYRLDRDPRGAGLAERTDFFAEAAEGLIERAYRGEAEPPAHLVHVTCTGYVSPSAAQLLVARRGWPTVVTHAYHMGCAGALPATRLAAAFCVPGGRVDVVHTELCSLHLDPTDPSPQQLVAAGLFADGAIRYSASAARPSGPGFELVAQLERLIPDTEDAMTWRPGSSSMRMTLSQRMPSFILEHLREFMERLFGSAGLAFDSAKAGAAFAIHPGGPKIIDASVEALGLGEAQVAWSRKVLLEHGNMSSATIPYVWAEIAADPGVPAGTLVPGVAFGPGLTVSGAILRKL